MRINMVMNKVGLNLTKLKEIKAPEIAIETNPLQILISVRNRANEYTGGYFGLGIMTTLFIFLIYKLGRGNEVINEQYSEVRTWGISAGVVSIFGAMMISLGFFSEFFHVVIFAGICLLAWIFIAVQSRR